MVLLIKDKIISYLWDNTELVCRILRQVSESPDGWDGSAKFHRESVDSLVPTRQADASRAIVGGNTIAENYAFVGVHHIFDQVNRPKIMGYLP